MPKRRQTVTHRGDTKPPTDLARFIELVNAERLYERELPDAHKTLYAAMDDPVNASVAPRVLWIQQCAEIASELRPETRAHLGSASNLEQFLERYELLSAAGKILQGIAKRRAPGSHGQSNELMVHDTRFPVDVPFTVPIAMVVNGDGLLAVKPENPLVASLVDVPADRIRSCAICGQVFWAPRANSECCSEKCRKTYNQRNSRENRRFRRRKRK